MATVPMDRAKVARCRVIAAEIADDVQRYIDAHTTVGVERTILRAYGADGESDTLRVYAAKSATDYDAQVARARTIAGSL